MSADHNYMAFPQGEHTLAQVFSFLCGVTASNLETPLSNNYDNNAIISVSTTSVKQSTKDSNYACDQCGLRVHGSSEQLRKHYFHIALKIYFCRNCGCIYRNEECLNEHMNQVHVRKEAAQNFSSVCGAGKQTVKRVIPLLFMVKELINSDYKEQEGTESTNDDLETAVQQSETEMPTKITCDNEDASKDSPIKTKTPSPNYTQKPKHQLKLNRKKTSITRFRCLKCGKVFSTRGLLRRHNTVVHMKVYKCEECEDRPTFRTLGERLNHIRTVHKAQKVKLAAKSTLCETCGKQFKTPNALRCHKIVHATPNSDYTCSQCGKMFRNRRFLKAHETITHGSEKPFICHLCGKRLKRRNCLDLHLKRHYNIKNLSCDVCGRRFDMKSNLTRHILTHTGEKPFKCDVCGVGFQQKFGLDTHMLRHNNVHKYTCEICGKRSRIKCAHQKHMLTHINKGEYFKGDYRNTELYDSNNKVEYQDLQIPFENRYKCDQCGKSFSNNTYLHLHMAVHSDERNYKCDECDKMFKTNHALYLHKKVHLSKVNPILYDCNICNKRFQAVQYVRTHLKYFHPEALKGNPKGNGLYEKVSNEQGSPLNEPSSSKDNSISEQEDTVELF